MMILKNLLTFLQRKLNMPSSIMHAENKLEPLLLGQQVWLHIKDDTMPPKARVAHKTLIISLRGRTIVFSIPGYGCEMCDIDEISVQVLYKAGLGARNSKILEQELRKLFDKQIDR